MTEYRVKNTEYRRKTRDARRCGITLIEMLVSLAIITIIIAVIVPQFVTVRNTWDSKQGAAEALQNGRILTDHLSRNLAKAVRIAAVSNSDETNGFIQFEDNDGNNLRYDINSTSNYVEFGYLGNLSDLAGPVSQLQFSCYDACDLDTPLDMSTADVNDIRFVKADTTLTNSSTLGQDETLIASAYLRTNDESSVCDSNLVGWWKLDETSGLTAEDSSGNGNDGTLTNMIGDEWTTGTVGGALEFDGFNDYVDCGNDSSLQITGDLTIAAWVQLASGNSGGYYGIAGKLYDISYAGFALVRHSSNYFRFFIADGSSIEGIDSDVTYTDTAWHHVAGVRRSGTNYLYIDGVEQTATSTTALSDSGDYAFIGRQYSNYNDRYFDGIIDDVRIYNCALDANEISELANPGVTYEEFTEAKADSDTTSITISTPGGSGVSILGSWTTGLTHTAEAGSNRALIFIAHDESASGDPSLISVTYGGQTMTKVIEISAVTTYGNYVAAFILDEAGINAATSSTFTPTWSGAPGAVAYASVFLSNVDQTTSIGATDSASTTTGTNPIETNPLSTEDGDMVIVAATCGNLGSYTLNNGFTEGIDQQFGDATTGGTGVAGHKSATGVTETPKATYSATVNRQVIIGFVVQGGDISDIEGDLLIAAVATDGSETISPPGGEDWTEIDIDDYIGEVTLGAWWKLADDSESSSHEFTWLGDEQAYGWMMRFTGHDPTDPINDWLASGESSSTPTSPGVTTTVDNCLILRLGAFDGDDITVDDPGLSGHTAITMDKSGSGGGGSAVSILGSWASGTTHAKESGTDRALIFIAHAESTGSMNLSSVTYGGQAMTKVTDWNYNAAFGYAYAAAYILDETGIDAAFGNTFVPTWSFPAPSGSGYASVFLSNVNQTTSTGATASGGSISNTVTTSSALATSNGDMVIDAATCGQAGSYTLNNGFTEGIDQQINGTVTGVTGHKSATGANETPSATWSGFGINRQMIIGFVVQVVAGGDSDTVSGGAGYVSQSVSGDSGTSTFTLGSSNEAQMLTIAIAPDSNDDSGCVNQIRP